MLASNPRTLWLISPKRPYISKNENPSVNGGEKSGKVAIRRSALRPRSSGRLMATA